MRDLLPLMITPAPTPPATGEDWEEPFKDLLRELAEPRDLAHKNIGGRILDYVRSKKSLWQAEARREEQSAAHRVIKAAYRQSSEEKAAILIEILAKAESMATAKEIRHLIKDYLLQSDKQ